MSVRLEMKGLSELRDALQSLPDELTDDASRIVQEHAAEAQSEIIQGYPEGPTGNLKRGVTRDQVRGKLSTRAIIRSRAKHAHLFEFGTRARRTDSGANRGTMPKAPEHQAMLPVVIRKRRAMVQALIELVRKAGFQVTG